MNFWNRNFNCERPDLLYFCLRELEGGSAQIPCGPKSKKILIDTFKVQYFPLT